MATTALDVITGALQEIGVLAPEEVPTLSDATVGLRALNDLVDQWAAERLQIYAIVRTTWTIVASTQTYTVGSGGAVAIARPMYIDRVTFSDSTPTIPIEYPLDLLTEDAWANVTQKTLTSPFPTSVYYSAAYPLGVLSFWPIPTASTLSGVIYAPTAVTEFAALSTAVALPPGYRRMIVKNLAADLCSSFERELTPSLIRDAEESKHVVSRSNKRLMDMSIDIGALGQGGGFSYDIRSGP